MTDSSLGATWNSARPNPSAGPATGWSASINCMADPFAMTIATSVATKIADNLAEGARQAVLAIVRKVRDKLRSRPGEPADVATLDAAIASGDELAAAALARLLEALFTADPRFREEVETLWDSGHPDDSVTNVFHGKADRVIMMRDVHGDLTIN